MPIADKFIFVNIFQAVKRYAANRSAGKNGFNTGNNGSRREALKSRLTAYICKKNL